jgi:stage III sporulation protein AA
MVFDFMPDIYGQALNKINNDVCEIRLRIGFPVKIKIMLKEFYLAYNGYSVYKNDAIVCREEHIEYIIDKVTERSIYAFNEQIKKGFLTTKNGVRIGIAGCCVYEKNSIVTIKNISSLNIRVPKFINGCADDVYAKIYTKYEVFNTLIFSSPMGGKTTVLKDIAKKLSNEKNENILIIDERGEFFKVRGENIDVITYGDKLYSFEYGLRSMSPTIIITDELQTRDDWLCVERAVNCGVKIIATCHARTITDIINKDYFRRGVFDRFIMLKNENTIGQVKIVYDKDFNEL